MVALFSCSSLRFCDAEELLFGLVKMSLHVSSELYSLMHFVIGLFLPRRMKAELKPIEISVDRGFLFALWRIFDVSESDKGENLDVRIASFLCYFSIIVCSLRKNSLKY